MIMYSYGPYLPKTVHDHGTISRPWDAAKCGLRLALDHAAGHLTGQVIHVNGGTWLGR